LLAGFGTDWLRREQPMKTAGEENPNSHVRLYNEPTESMGRKVRTILAHSHGLKSKKKSGGRRGVSLDFSFYRTYQMG
jgi:hypothetical protein